MKNQIIFGAFCIAGIAQARLDLKAEIVNDFINYAADNNKWYPTTAEFIRCCDNYEMSSRRIDRCNAEDNTYECGHNFTSDMDEGDYHKFMGLSQDYQFYITDDDGTML